MWILGIVLGLVIYSFIVVMVYGLFGRLFWSQHGMTMEEYERKWKRNDGEISFLYLLGSIFWPITIIVLFLVKLGKFCNWAGPYVFWIHRWLYRMVRGNINKSESSTGGPYRKLVRPKDDVPLREAPKGTKLYES